MLSNATDKLNCSWFLFFLYIHCLQVAITMTPEGGSWVYPYIKISSSPYRSLIHQAQERSMSPTFFEQFLAFIVPQEPDKWKYCKMGPTVFRPYPRRLENLTVLQMSLQMQHFLLSYLKCLTLVHPGLNLQPPAQQTSTLPTELTRWQSLNLFFINCHFSLGWKAQMLHGNMTKNLLLRWMK